MSPEPIETPTTITEPGRYALAKEIEHGGGTTLSEAFVRIEADDVVLDGGGLLLGGNGVSDTVGILATDARNVIVENVTVSEWDFGVRFENVIGGRVRNVRAVGNGYGLSFDDTHMVVVSESEVSGNLLGIVLDSTSEVLQWHNAVEANVGRDVYRSSLCRD